MSNHKRKAIEDDDDTPTPVSADLAIASFVKANYGFQLSKPEDFDAPCFFYPKSTITTEKGKTTKHPLFEWPESQIQLGTLAGGVSQTNRRALAKGYLEAKIEVLVVPLQCFGNDTVKSMAAALQKSESIFANHANTWTGKPPKKDEEDKE